MALQVASLEPQQFNVLGGVNELIDIASAPADVFAMVQGVFPEFSGELSRLPGKVLISNASSPVKGIHQYFTPFGTYVNLITLENELDFHECPTSFTGLKYNSPPSSLGTDSTGNSLNLYRRTGRAASAMLGVPSPAAFTSCIYMKEVVTNTWTVNISAIIGGPYNGFRIVISDGTTSTYTDYSIGSSTINFSSQMAIVTTQPYLSFFAVENLGCSETLTPLNITLNDFVAAPGVVPTIESGTIFTTEPAGDFPLVTLATFTVAP